MPRRPRRPRRPRSPVGFKPSTQNALLSLDFKSHEATKITPNWVNSKAIEQKCKSMSKAVKTPKVQNRRGQTCLGCLTSGHLRSPTPPSKAAARSCKSQQHPPIFKTYGSPRSRRPAIPVPRVPRVPRAPRSPDVFKPLRPNALSSLDFKSLEVTKTVRKVKLP